MCFEFSVDLRKENEFAELDKTRLYCGFCQITRRKGIFILGIIRLGVCLLMFVTCTVVTGLQQQIYDNIGHKLENIKSNHTSFNDYEFQTTETFLVGTKNL